LPLLEKAQRIAANSVSKSYKLYETPELSKQKEKSGWFMIAYNCGPLQGYLVLA
jgi:hypothetical protein